MNGALKSWQANLSARIELDSLDQPYDRSVAVIAGLILGGCVVAAIADNLPRIILIPIGWATFALVGWLALKFLRRKTKEHPEPVKFPPPPSGKWESEADLYARTMGDRFLGQAATLLLLPPALAMIATTSVSGNPRWASGVVVGATAIDLIAAPTLWLSLRPVHAHVKRTFRDEWFTSLREITSPVASRAAELTALATELQNRAAGAEGIILEVEALMKELEGEVATRQGEYSELLNAVVEEQKLSKVSQADADLVLAGWTQRQDVTRRKDRWKARGSALFWAIIGAVVAYAMTVVYVPDALHDRLFR